MSNKSQMIKMVQTQTHETLSLNSIRNDQCAEEATAEGDDRNLDPETSGTTELSSWFKILSQLRDSQFNVRQKIVVIVKYTASENVK